MRSRTALLRSAAGAVLAAGLVAAQLAGVLSDHRLLVFVPAVVLVVLASIGQAFTRTALPRRFGQVSGECDVLLMASELLLVAFLFRPDVRDGSSRRVVLTAVLVLQAARVMHQLFAAASEEWRSRRADSRGLGLDRIALPSPARVLTTPGAVAVRIVAVLIPIAGAVDPAGSPDVFSTVAIVCAALSLTVPVCAAVPLLRLRRLPRGSRLFATVRRAAEAHAPVTVLYCSSGPKDAFHVDVWLETLERMNRPAIVMLRDAATFAALARTSTPVVLVPDERDVVAFVPDSARVALYVANGPENFRLLRSLSMRSAYLNHGDSDKTSSFNPVSRVYDEVWVAGPAGRQRYLDAGIGVRPESIRLIGRPQTARIEHGPRTSPGLYTVLYAPTWEGFTHDDYESSVTRNGAAVVSSLLAQGVRVVYRPHPRTGRTDSRTYRANEEVLQMVAEAGAPHRCFVGAGVDIAELFNEADALVSDISAVISDYIVTGRPYFVVNGKDEPSEAFRRRAPSVSAAYLVGNGAAGLAEGLAEARSTDTKSTERAALRDFLLGDTSADPFEVFGRAVDDLAGRGRPNDRGLEGSASPSASGQ